MGNLPTSLVIADTTTVSSRLAPEVLPGPVGLEPVIELCLSDTMADSQSPCCGTNPGRMHLLLLFQTLCESHLQMTVEQWGWGNNLRGGVHLPYQSEEGPG